MKIIRNFVKQPLLVHNNHNPKKAILAYKGYNFITWEKEINHTLTYVLFLTSDFTASEANFNGRLLNKSAAISCLIRLTIEKTLLSIVTSASCETPLAIYNLIFNQLTAIMSENSEINGYQIQQNSWFDVTRVI
ncbi:uncharacterized protein VP01_242g5 [Puccinia sorghi]|uniref:Uncharacterized protein n=1 Tax=Puccinia sorghi TaxID=27349 RepID=A0A0L6V8B7_9BASI|nr:uncharacterized protein VP01_242g5 [Puccinia sorghi]